MSTRAGAAARMAGLIASAAAVLLAAPPSPAHAQVAAQISPHGELSIEIDCVACHTSEGWRPARTEMDFDHDAATGFPLDGRHVAATCAGCHLELRFDEPRVAPEDCAYCHIDVHQGRFSDDCVACHDTNSFAARMGPEVHARTNFPLTGAHAQIPCEGCHTDDRAGAFAPLPSDCVACHGRQYRATTFPDHAALGYPVDCRACHGTTTWHGAPFDHVQASGGFELLGSHARIACTSCHSPPNGEVRYAASGSADCFACHRADYDREHGGRGFPTTCQTCHTTETWDDATYDHDAQFFPIFSGKHEEKWNSCGDCHPSSPESYAVFTCLTCHTSGKTNEQHSEVSGYAYESASCLACHPQGGD